MPEKIGGLIPPTPTSSPLKTSELETSIIFISPSWNSRPSGLCLWESFPPFPPISTWRKLDFLTREDKTGGGGGSWEDDDGPSLEPVAGLRWGNDPSRESKFSSSSSSWSSLISSLASSSSSPVWNWRAFHFDIPGGIPKVVASPPPSPSSSG